MRSWRSGVVCRSRLLVGPVQIPPSAVFSYFFPFSSIFSFFPFFPFFFGLWFKSRLVLGLGLDQGSQGTYEGSSF